jgi:hypothetical protein
MRLSTEFIHLLELFISNTSNWFFQNLYFFIELHFQIPAFASLFYSSVYLSWFISLHCLWMLVILTIILLNFIQSLSLESIAEELLNYAKALLPHFSYFWVSVLRSMYLEVGHYWKSKSPIFFHACLTSTKSWVSNTSTVNKKRKEWRRKWRSFLRVSLFL